MVGIDRTVTPGVVMSSTNTLMPACFGGRGIGAGEQEAEVGRGVRVARTRSSGRSPRSGRPRGTRLAERGEVGTCVGLREQLCLQITSPRAIGGRSSSCCSGRAEAHDERSDVVEVHVLRATRLLVRPHLLAQERSASTRSAPVPPCSGGQAIVEPTPRHELPADLAGDGITRSSSTNMPRHQSGSASARNCPELRPQLLLFGGEGEVHARRVGRRHRQRSARTMPPSTVKHAPVIHEPRVGAEQHDESGHVGRLPRRPAGIGRFPHRAGP